MIDSKTRELFSIGVSVAVKCQPCLDYHVEEARKAGASDSEMRNAVSIARMIRKAGVENVDQYADEKLGGAESEQPAPSACCCSGESCCGE